MDALLVSSSEAASELVQTLRFEMTMCLVTMACALAIQSLSGRQTAGKTSAQASGVAQQRLKAPPPPPRSSKGGDAGGSGRILAKRRAVDAFLEIVEAAKENTSIRVAFRALYVYQEKLRPSLTDGVTINTISETTSHQPLQLYAILVTSAVRVGKYDLIDGLCKDMNEQGITRTLSFYESAMRQLAKQRQYHLALAMYDMLERDGLSPSAATMSCLIGFAAEIGEFERAVGFFENLRSWTTPCIRTYMAVLRVHFKRQDSKASVEIIRDMEKRGVGIDSYAFNIVLATCVAADELAAVEELMTEGDAREPPSTDVISYNTMMKAWASHGNIQKAKAALGKMQARGLKPNAITFNTAMDAMVRGGRSRDAWVLLMDMQAAGLKPDKFTTSTLIKALEQAPTELEVRLALQLLMDTDDSCDSTLKPMLYKSVLEACAQVKGGSNLLAMAFSQMRRVGVRPSPAVQRLLEKRLPRAAVRDLFKGVSKA